MEKIGSPNGRIKAGQGKCLLNGRHKSRGGHMGTKSKSGQTKEFSPDHFGHQFMRIREWVLNNTEPYSTIGRTRVPYKTL